MRNSYHHCFFLHSSRSIKEKWEFGSYHHHWNKINCNVKKMRAGSLSLCATHSNNNKTCKEVFFQQSLKPEICFINPKANAKKAKARDTKKWCFISMRTSLLKINVCITSDLLERIDILRQLHLITREIVYKSVEDRQQYFHTKWHSQAHLQQAIKAQRYKRKRKKETKQDHSSRYFHRRHEILQNALLCSSVKRVHSSYLDKVHTYDMIVHV